MDWLNYHHLLHFRVIAREGSMKQAREALTLSQPALSAQLRALEDAMGEQQFSRRIPCLPPRRLRIFP